MDASIIIAVIANEPEKQRLVHMTKGAELIAPASVHWEIGNAFSAMMKRGRVTIEQTLEAIENYHQIPIRYLDIDLGESLVIAKEYGMYAYDAYILRCALKYQSALFTLDRRLAEAALEMNIDVVEV